MVDQKAQMFFVAVHTLIVLQFHCDGVRLCPGDQVALAGDAMVSLTCQPTGAESEWLRIFHTDLQHTIYNGFDDPFPDGIDLARTTASKNNVSGALALNIKDVKLEDALTFGCRDTATGEETKAHLIVLESLPVMERHIVSSSTVEMRCLFKYRGPPAAASVTWLDRHGHQMNEFNHGERILDGVASKVSVSLKNTELWPASCQVSFSLRRQCGETENIEMRTFQSTDEFIYEDDYTTKTYTVFGVFDVHYPGHLITFVASTVVLILVIIICAQCFTVRHWRRMNLSVDTETGTENLSSSDETNSPLMKEAITEKGPTYEELRGQSSESPYVVEAYEELQRQSPDSSYVINVR